MTNWMRSRLPLIAGTHADGTLLLGETTINELLGRVAHPHVTVQVFEENAIVVRHGVFHARMTLPMRLETGPSPRLTVSLSSLLVALALRAALHKPFVHVHGKRVTVQLAEIPELAEWRDFWTYLTSLEFSTDARLVRVRFRLAVDDGGSHA